MNISAKLLRASMLLATILTFNVAQAAPVLDLDFSPTSAGFCARSTCNWQQQGVSSATGTLAGITLYGNGLTDVKIGIGSGNAFSLYVGSWLATLSQVSLAGGGSYFDLSSYGLNIAAGDVIAFAFENGTGSYSGSYPAIANGGLFLNGNAFNDWSIGFQTFVESGNVPEPATLLLAGFALAGIAASRRKA